MNSKVGGTFEQRWGRRKTHDPFQEETGQQVEMEEGKGWRTDYSTAINAKQGSANYSPGQINPFVLYIKFY